jgi:hypothetical protein
MALIPVVLFRHDTHGKARRKGFSNDSKRDDFAVNKSHPTLTRALRSIEIFE